MRQKDGESDLELQLYEPRHLVSSFTLLGDIPTSFNRFAGIGLGPNSHANSARRSRFRSVPMTIATRNSGIITFKARERTERWPAAGIFSGEVSEKGRTRINRLSLSHIIADIERLAAGQIARTSDSQTRVIVE